LLLDGNYEQRPATPKNRGAKFVALLIGLSVAGLLLLAALLAGLGWMEFAFWRGSGG